MNFIRCLIYLLALLTAGLVPRPSKDGGDSIVSCDTGQAIMQRRLWGSQILLDTQFDPHAEPQPELMKSVYELQGKWWGPKSQIRLTSVSNMAPPISAAVLFSNRHETVPPEVTDRNTAPPFFEALFSCNSMITCASSVIIEINTRYWEGSYMKCCNLEVAL